MNGNDAARTSAPVTEVASLIAGIEAALDQWAAATSTWLEASGKITGTAIDKFIRPTVLDMMNNPTSLTAGAGFVAADGIMGVNRSYIAWWQGSDMERVDALANFSPHATSRYIKAEWFKLPMATGKPHVTGPYIDLLCTDEYVLTFTHPLYKDGAFAGVVGLDVTAQSLERATLGLLRTIGPNAVLVNSDGRSIVSAGADVDAGDVVQAASGAQEYAAGRHFRIISATA
ncbi:cache domain-containing protein [Arthrobacter sp. HLT1-20]